MDRKYDAFISYRHSELDMYVAKAIEKKLETFKLPKALKNKANRPKIERVFRDQDELPIASDLNEQIMAAIEVTDYLIVICTPRLPESKWCLSEITNFKRLHGKNHILAVLAEGEPDDSFPDELLLEDVERIDANGEKIIEQVRIEPLAADVRGTNKKEMNKKIDDAVMRLAAAIFGVNYDDLKQRHREREMRKTLVKMSIAASVFMVFAVVSTIFMINLAGKNREITIQNDMITSQKEEIEVQKAELEKQYKTVQKNYIAIMTNTAGELIKTGRKKEAIYALLSVIPESSDDEMYSVDCHRILNECMNVNAIDRDYVLSGSVEMDAEVRDIKISPRGDYLLIEDRSGYIRIIRAENAECIDKIEYEQFKYFGFIDDTHFVYSIEGEDYFHGKGMVYSIEDKSTSELGLGTILNKCNNEGNDKYVVYSDTDILLFRTEEYEAYKTYNRSNLNPGVTGKGIITSCRFINESDLLIISTLGGVFNIAVYDVDNDELKVDKDLDITNYYINCLNDGNILYIVTSDKILAKDMYLLTYDCDIYAIDVNNGDIINHNRIEELPTQNMGISRNYGLVFTDNRYFKVIDCESLEEINELRYVYEKSDEILNVMLTNKAEVAIIAYKNGNYEGYVIGMDQQYGYDFVDNNYNKTLKLSIMANGLLVQTLKGETNVIILKEYDHEGISYDSYNYGAAADERGIYTLIAAEKENRAVIELVDNETNLAVNTYGDYSASISYFGFINKGDKFYIIADKCYVYNSDNGELLFTIDKEDYGLDNAKFERPEIKTATVTISDIRNSIKYYTVISLEDGSVLNEVDTAFEKEGKYDSKFTVSPMDGAYFALYDDRNEIRVYKKDEILPNQTMSINYKLIKNACISSDNKYLVLLYLDNKIEFYNLNELIL